MASSFDPTNQDNSTGHEQRNIMQPLYNTRPSPWLDLKVFYVRLCNCAVDKPVPDHLTLNQFPLTPDTILEINGRRGGITTESASSTLRRDRVDKKSEEVIFVSTDSIRMTGSVRFEVNDGDHMLLSGVLEPLKSTGLRGEPTRKWSMKCQPVISGSSPFLKGKKYTSPEMALPMIEVYVAGSFSGSAIILMKTLQLGIRKKSRMRSAFDSIPENDAYEAEKDELIKEAQQSIEYEGFMPENDVDIDDNNLYMKSEYEEGDNGELTWFNAGVRVGMGLGLGICLGVGVGVGLLVKTYKTTTRHFRKRLI